MDNIEKYYKDKLKMTDKEREELYQEHLKVEKDINKLFCFKNYKKTYIFLFLVRYKSHI